MMIAQKDVTKENIVDYVNSFVWRKKEDGTFIGIRKDANGKAEFLEVTNRHV